MALPRKLTAAEKPTFLASFPLLDVDFTIVTDEPSGIYNCISWSVGVTNTWHWPGSTLANFDSFYAQFNLVRKTKGTVATWGFSDTNMTHGCVSGPIHGPCWESKCGSLARIQHCLNELNGPAYGHVIQYYGARRIFKDPFFPKYFLNYIEVKRAFTKEEIRLVESLVKETSKETAAAFEKTFNAWKKSWLAGSLAFSSDPYARTKSEAYKEMIGLGKDIIPLLVSKLMDENNFLALPAFEQLAGKRSTIQIDAADEKIQEGEQGRAFRTVKNYLDKLKG